MSQSSYAAPAVYTPPTIYNPPTAYTPPTSVPVQTSASTFAATRPRDEKGRFISRKTAEEQGIPFPSMAQASRDEKGRFDSASTTPQVKDIYSTPPATKTKSAAAKDRPRDAKGRFVKLTEDAVSGTEATNRRPLEAKKRVVKRLVLSPAETDTNNSPSTLDTTSDVTNRRPKPQNSKRRVVKHTDADSQADATPVANTKTASSADTTKHSKAQMSTLHPAASRPRDEKGRFISRKRAEELGMPFPAMSDVPRDEKGRFVSASGGENRRKKDVRSTSSTKTRSDAKNTAKDQTWQTSAANSLNYEDYGEENDESDNDYDSELENIAHRYPQNPYPPQPTEHNNLPYNYHNEQSYEELCPYQLREYCPNGDSCPYIHQYEANNMGTKLPEEGHDQDTLDDESSEDSASYSETDEIYVEDRGTQTDEWIELNEYRALLQKGNAMCRRIMTKWTIHEAICERDPQILIDLCALFPFQAANPATPPKNI
uniref:C3H1-type domain-containing protein n=1 Tax=Plectus sambesii TaxID=2011161 RepID=A0A914WK89_9BILA